MSTLRRLPGFNFEVQAPPLTDALPRMDVAVFVGFARSGPLHIPVAVEAYTQFSDIFGDEAPLAWDKQRGGPAPAYLANAVRDFFQNGGVRCWIIRVAGAAEANYFVVPGLARCQNTVVMPAYARARSEGSWSDGHQVSAALLSRGLWINSVQFSEKEPVAKNEPAVAIELDLTSPDEVLPGDLLRLTYADDGYLLIVPLNDLRPVPGPNQVAAGSQLPTGERAQLLGHDLLWFRQAWKQQPPAINSAQVTLWNHLGQTQSLHGWAVVRPDGSPPGKPDWPTNPDDPTVSIDVAMSLESAPPPGSLVRVDFQGSPPPPVIGPFWLVVSSVTDSPRTVTGNLPPASANHVTRLTGSGLWQLMLIKPPANLPAKPTYTERLTFELWSRQGSANPQKMSDLGFTPSHVRFWGTLPTDAQLYAPGETANLKPTPALWMAAAAPRFPLVSSEAPTDDLILPGGEINLQALSTGDQPFFLPIAMPALPSIFTRAEEQANLPLKRDGLERFDNSLFLDEEMCTASLETLIDRADYLRYFSPKPRRLKGIYAALEIAEATLVAVPDAIQLAWDLYNPALPPSPTESKPLPHPEWVACPNISPTTTTSLPSHPNRGQFLPCNLIVLRAPTWKKDVPLTSPNGTFDLAWRSIKAADAYILEEATLPDYTNAVELYRGRTNKVTVYGRGAGNYYYRVRAVAGAVTSNWRNLAHAIQVAPPSCYEVKKAGDDHNQKQNLLAIQRSLLRMCAARGDLLAVLALPGHYHRDDVIDFVRSLKSPFETVSGQPQENPLNSKLTIPPIGFGETRAFNFGAIYHPWLVSRAGSANIAFTSGPPDGGACGLIARRALQRGAWVAPANDPLAGVVALTPTIGKEHWLELQNAQLNLVRQEPEGFVILSEDTLFDDQDLRPINVRRLLMLLRRLALREGPSFVFEPNSDAFHRRVQRTFQAYLEDLFRRGAFAGATPETSFVVTAGATPEQIDQGQFVVELKVAPSQPLTFITIRLIQSVDRSQVIEVS